MSEGRPTDVSDSFTVVSSVETLGRDDEQTSASEQQQQQQHTVSDSEPVKESVNDVQGKHYNLRLSILYRVAQLK